jgi:hypothetical protein
LLKLSSDSENNDGQDNREPTGRYANGFTVGHNAFEFLLDFYQSYAEDKPALLHTRVITTPVYAKSLLALLRKSIDQYENVFGTIPDEDV